MDYQEMLQQFMDGKISREKLNELAKLRADVRWLEAQNQVTAQMMQQYGSGGGGGGAAHSTSIGHVAIGSGATANSNYSIAIGSGTTLTVLTNVARADHTHDGLPLAAIGTEQLLEDAIRFMQAAAKRAPANGTQWVQKLAKAIKEMRNGWATEAPKEED